jgi:hypothetical protein
MKADSTLRTSRALPHPSTNLALRRLTSEVERDPVHSARYGRQRKHTPNGQQLPKLRREGPNKSSVVLVALTAQTECSLGFGEV